MDDRSAVKTDIGNRDLFGIAERPATIGLSVLIALKIIFLFALAYRSRFVMDEFGQVGYAKYLGNGLFDTIQPAKAVGFTVFRSWPFSLAGMRRPLCSWGASRWRCSPARPSL